MPHIFRLFFGLTALLAVFFSAPVLADPSGRVGRISLLDGPSLLRADRDDSGTQAALNWPVSSGAIIDTENGSRAEIWVGSTAFRLAGESRLEFGLVDDRQIHLSLATGTLAITIRDHNQADDVEVRTPHGRLKFASAGSYRIDVGTLYTNLSTISGNASIVNSERPINVGPNRMVSIDLNGAVASYGDARRDRFDDWTAARDAATQVRTTNQYISPEMTGYQDLEHYGEWSSLPEYGSVWYPRAVPTGWAPYRDGRWAWVAPWGWTWVDAAPWGFAPFHYGRWLEVRGRWAWAPGSYVARPVYAPALVAWVGNPGWNVRFSAGSAPAVGWFPLAPREVYVPSYRTSNNYVRQVNVTHVTNINVVERAISERGERHFVHRDSARAVTVVPANTLHDSRPISGANLPSRTQVELRQAPVSGQAPATNWVAPSNAIAPARPSGAPGVAREMRDSPRTPARQETIESTPPRNTNEPTRNANDIRGERPRNGIDTPRPETLQRPLPPGISRLPAEPLATPGASLPTAQAMRPATPTTVTPAQPSAERPRSEPKEAMSQPPTAPQPPAPTISERSAERRSAPSPVAPVLQTRPALPPPSVPTTIAPGERPRTEPKEVMVQPPAAPQPPAPTISERPAERRSDPSTVAPALQTRTALPPPSVPTTIAPGERPRTEPKEVMVQPPAAPRPPAPPISERPAERRSDPSPMAPAPQTRPALPPPSMPTQPNFERSGVELRPTPQTAERPPERRNERPPAVVSEPMPQMRAPTPSPQLPPPVSERPRNEPRPQAPLETRSPPPAMERMPQIEHRIERPAPIVSEPPRQREMAPPVQAPRPPSPPAMATPTREAPQMERRPPPPEQRPAPPPRDDQSRHQEKDKEKRPGAP